MCLSGQLVTPFLNQPMGTGSFFRADNGLTVLPEKITFKDVSPEQLEARCEHLGLSIEQITQLRKGLGIDSDRGIHPKAPESGVSISNEKEFLKACLSNDAKLTPFLLRLALPPCQSPMIPLIGASQSGKSTLFHELVQTDSTDRIGNGSESKTGVCQQSFMDGYSLIDTPGLNHTQMGLTNILVEYQLSELMVSGQFPTIVVTLTEKDILPPFTTNGIRTLMMFFDRFFDLRLMDGGFYESILNDYLGTDDYSGMLTTLDASRDLDAQSPEQDILVEGAREGIKQTWNDCLDAIGTAIESMPSTPFTVFVRDNESDLDEDEQLTPKKLDRNISRYINRLKTHILEQVLTNYGIISPETDDLMGCLIYIFTIKKNVTVTNSMNSEAKRSRVGASFNAPFNFEAIKLDECHIDYRFITLLSVMVHELNNQSSVRSRLKESIDSTETDIDSTNGRIHCLHRQEASEQANYISQLDIKVKEIKGGIEYYSNRLKKKLATLNDLNTEELIPIYEKSKSIGWKLNPGAFKRQLFNGCAFKVLYPYDKYEVFYFCEGGEHGDLHPMPRDYVHVKEQQITIMPLPWGCKEIRLKLYQQKKKKYEKEVCDETSEINRYENEINRLKELLSVNESIIKRRIDEPINGEEETRALIEQETTELDSLKSKLRSYIDECENVRVNYADIRFVYDCLGNESFKYLQQLFSKFYGADVKHAFMQSFETEFGKPGVESFQVVNISEAGALGSEAVSIHPNMVRQTVVAGDMSRRADGEEGWL